MTSGKTRWVGPLYVHILKWCFFVLEKKTFWVEKWGRKSCQLSVSVSCIPIHCVSGGSKAEQWFDGTSTFERLLGEWNTILLTPVNRWLYDCLFLLVEEGKIWPPLPDFYDPESTFVTECCRSPKLYCPCTSSMKLRRYYHFFLPLLLLYCESLVKLTCQSWVTFQTGVPHWTISIIFPSLKQ